MPARRPPALGRRFPDRAEAEHVPTQTRGHREARVDHRAELPGQLGSTAEPVEIEPQHLLNVGHAGAGESRRTGDAVSPDTSRGHRCPCDRGPASSIAARHASAVSNERVEAEPPADLGLPDARHRGASLESLQLGPSFACSAQRKDSSPMAMGLCSVASSGASRPARRAGCRRRRRARRSTPFTGIPILDLIVARSRRCWW